MHDASPAPAGKIDKTDNPRGRFNTSDAATALHLCYGEIGISAVAAAARYQGSAKNPAYAPAAIRTDERQRD